MLIVAAVHLKPETPILDDIATSIARDVHQHQE
jgi:hypothetical protein